MLNVGSDFFKHDYGKDYLFLPGTETCAKTCIDPTIDPLHSPCEWLKSPNSMSGNAKDCIVANWLTG